MTLAETNRRGHATRFAQGAAADGRRRRRRARWRRHAERGGQRPRRHRRRRSRALPGGSTNVFARTIGLPERPDRGDRRAARRARRRTRSAASGSAASTAATSSSTPASASTPRSSRQVERRDTFKRWFGHPAVHLRDRRHAGCAHYDRQHPHFAVRFSDARPVVDDGYFTIVHEHRPLHVPRQPAVRHRARGHARPRARRR